MPQRRHFIKSFIGLGLSGATLQFKSPQNFSQKLSSIQNTDEKWKLVKYQFPVTQVKTYFNNGTMGPSPYPVIDTVNSYQNWMETNGEYKGTEDARDRLGKFLGVSTDTISLTHNTTEGINLIAWGLPLKSGDEVIMTTHEHVGNAVPWLNRAKIDGIVIKPFEPALTADENIARIQQLITPKTRVIAIPHITTTTGTRFPAKEIAELGKQQGVWVFLDGAHGPGILDLNLDEMGVDFYAASTHKWMCGPNGTGFLYIKSSLLDTVQVHHVGAYSDTGWELSLTQQQLNGYVPTAHRYDYATQNAALFQGVCAAIDFWELLGKTEVEARVLELSGYLQQGLLEVGDKVEMLTPQEQQSRSGMVTFRLKDMPYREFGKIAAKEKFRIRLVPESGLDAIRISTHVYNDFDDIDRFVQLVTATIG